MEEQKKKSRRWLLIPAAIFLLVVGFAAGRITAVYTPGSSDAFDNNAMLNKMQEIEAYIDYYFKGDIDSVKIQDGVYHGLVNGLGDTYSQYLTNDEYDQMKEDDAGEYRGIGIIVSKEYETGYVYIEQVMKNQPAYNAGVENGDILLSVDGHKTDEITLTETVNFIKKDPSDKTKLTLLRGNETLELEVDKDNIIVETVEYEMKDKKAGIGLISVSQFIENTDEHFISAVNDLESQGMKALIIDLRDNGGGIVDSCVNMVSRLIPEGDLIVYTEDKRGQKEEYLSNSSLTVDVPIIILVNNYTASASEIMTGCLKDYKRATVLGSQTYGKGIVQGVFPLGDGSAIELTYAGYCTPNGIDIHKKGIEPDIKIEYTREEWIEVRKDPKKDTQMKEALSVLKKQIGASDKKDKK